jgi:hypothetical protein
VLFINHAPINQLLQFHCVMDREVIQMALGPRSSAIMAHGLNLQGLAVTQHDNNDHALLSPSITHSILRDSSSSASGVLVPRAFFIDEPCATQPHPNENTDASQVESAAWRGKTQTMTRSDWNFDILIEEAPTGSTTVPSIVSPPPQDPALLQQQQHQFDHRMRQQASTLAYGQHSRYRQAMHSSSKQFPDMEEEEPEDRYASRYYDSDDDGDSDDREQKRQRQQEEQNRHWQRSSQQLSEQWSSWWGRQQGKQQQEQPLQSQPAASVAPPITTVSGVSTWMDLWMPPYAPTSYILLPWNRQALMSECYTTGASGNSNLGASWTEPEVLERVRRTLEDCDSYQGMVVTTDPGMYAGLTTSVVQFLHEECPRAQTLVLNVQLHALENAVTIAPSSDATTSFPSSYMAKTRRMRQSLEHGLAYHDWSELDCLMLPLILPAATAVDPNGFMHAARVAAAWETATLPWRLTSSSSASYSSDPIIAVNNNHSTDSYPYESRTRGMSLAYTVRTLQPASCYRVLSLDALSMTDPMARDTPLLIRHLKQGTSVERDDRMKQGPSLSSSTSAQRVDPGQWMEDVSQAGGMLSSLSTPSSIASTSPAVSPDRSMHMHTHAHFALSTSIRMALSTSSSPSKSPNSGSHILTPCDVLACVMQGIHIRYRPESSLACLVPSSFTDLTRDSVAGAYYYGSGLLHRSAATPTSVVSVVGNSTRSYIGLQMQASAMHAALKLRDGVSRDVAMGLLPEWDECVEAWGTVCALRDTYRPSSGGGGSGGYDDEDMGEEY